MWARVFVAALLAVVAGLAGAVVGSLGVWVADAVAPRTTVLGVAVAEDGPTSVPGAPRYGSYGWMTAVVTEDNRLIRLHSSSSSVPEWSGEPAVIQYSRLTGHPVTVRTASGYARLWLDNPLVVLAGLDAVLLGLAVVLVLAAVRVSRPDPAGPAVSDPAEPSDELSWRGCLLLLTVALLAFTAAAVPVSRTLTRMLSIGHDRAALAVGSAGPAPTRYPRQAPVGRAIRAGEFSIQVTGPVSTGPPPGAEAWLRQFHVLTVPVRVAFYSDDPTGSIQIELAGTGRGATELVPAAACGGRTVAFDGDWSTADPDPTAGRRICFVAPADFTPSHLLIGPPDTDTNAGTGTGTGAAIQLNPH